MLAALLGSSESILELQGPLGKALYRGKYARRTTQGLLAYSISKSQLELDYCLDTVKGEKIDLVTI
jgi:hypothetical protein